MPLWTLIVWLVIGGLAGWLAGRLMKQDAPFGLIGDIGVGILGAIVGGYLLGLLGFGGSGGIVGSFIVALLGACLLLWILRKVKKSSS